LIDAELGDSFDIKCWMVSFEGGVHLLKLVVFNALKMDLVQQECKRVLFTDDLKSILRLKNADRVFHARVEVNVLLLLLVAVHIHKGQIDLQDQALLLGELLVILEVNR